MTVKIVFLVLATMTLITMPAHATQAAVIPAYAYVSAFQSSMQEYLHYISIQNRAAARQLLISEKVFLAPRDVRVEVVAVVENIVKVKLNRLNENAEPVALYFWTLAEQLKILPQE